MNHFKHETAVVEEGAKIGNNTKIWHFAHIRGTAEIGNNCTISKDVYVDANAKIGNNVKIGNSVSIWNGMTIEDGVMISPNSCFTNDLYPRAEIWNEERLKKTLIMKGATIGANSTILCGIEIGKYALIGAGSVVTKNVPNHALVTGNPARVKGYVCTCGNRLDENFFCKSCKKEINIK